MDELKIPPVGKPGNNVPNISGQKDDFEALKVIPQFLTSVMGPREAAEQEDIFTLLIALRDAGTMTPEEIKNALEELKKAAKKVPKT